MRCRLVLAVLLCCMGAVPAFMISTCLKHVRVAESYSHSAAEAAAFDRVLSRTRAEDLPAAPQQSLDAANYLGDAETLAYRKRQRRDAVDQSLTLFDYAGGARRPRSRAEVLHGADLQPLIADRNAECSVEELHYKHRKLVVDAELIESRSVKHAVEEVVQALKPLLKAKVKVAVPDSGRFLKRTAE
jgi:hypothetical protein